MGIKLNPSRRCKGRPGYPGRLTRDGCRQILMIGTQPRTPPTSSNNKSNSWGYKIRGILYLSRPQNSETSWYSQGLPIFKALKRQPSSPSQQVLSYTSRWYNASQHSHLIYNVDDTCGQRFVFPFYVSVPETIPQPQKIPPAPPGTNYTLDGYTWGRVWSYRRSKATPGIYRSDQIRFLCLKSNWVYYLPQVLPMTRESEKSTIRIGDPLVATIMAQSTSFYRMRSLANRSPIGEAESMSPR